MLLLTYQNLRDVIEEFFDLYSTIDIKNNKLTDNEQAIIQIIKDFLEKLSIATKVYKSKQSAFNLVLLSMDYILVQFEKFKAEYKDNLIFNPMFNLGQAKMDKYYRLSDSTPIYITTLVLHPS